MVSTPINANEIFDALEAWIKQRPNLNQANYGMDPEQRRYSSSSQIREAMKCYRFEMRTIANQRKRALKALDEARNLTPARPDVLLSAFCAYSGRLQWEDGKLTYTTGQYWPTEYRAAAATVLETYIADWLKAEAAENPPTFTYRTMDDVIAANRSIGNHYFDPSTMRFFKSRVESGAVAIHDEHGKPTRARFVTSEKGPDGVRRYSVREAQPDGTIDTVGEFQQYRTLEQAFLYLIIAS